MKCLTRSLFGVAIAVGMVAFTSPAWAQELPGLPPGSPGPLPPEVSRPAPAHPPESTADPAADEAPPGAPLPIESVHFEPDEPELTLLVQRGQTPYRSLQRFRYTWYYERGVAALYAPVCDGPCTTQLAQGAYHFALSRDGGKVVPAGVVVVDGPSTLRATYEDHRGGRTLGGIIFAGGVVGGGVMVVAGVAHSGTDGPLLASGIGVFLAGVIVGTIFASQSDSAHVTVTPLALPSVGQRESYIAALASAPATAAPAAPQGAAVTVTF